MSVKHPIVAITGSSGAGTSTVTKSFDLVFRREKLNAAIVEGDSFHRYDRKEMRARQDDAEAAGADFLVERVLAKLFGLERGLAG